MKFRLNGAIFFMVLVVVVVIFSGANVLLGIDKHVSDLQITHEVDPEAENLMVGLDFDLPPYSYVEHETLKGLYVDLVKELANELGYNVTFIVDESSVLKAMAEMNEVDLVLGPAYLYKDHYFTSGISYSNIELFSNIKTPIGSWEELSGDTLLMIEETYLPEAIRDLNVEKKIVNGSSQALALIEDGSFDYALLPKDVGHYILSKKNYLNVKSNDLGQLSMINGIGSKDQTLTDQINNELQMLKLDGRYQALYDKWFGIYAKDLFIKLVEEHQILHILLLFVFILIVVLMFYQYWSLKKKTKRILMMNQAMRERKIRNNALLKAMPDLMFTFSPEGHIIVSKAPGMNLVNKTLVDLVGDKTMAYEYLDQTLEFNRISTFQFTYMVNGKRRFYEMRLSKCSHDEILGLARDITDDITRDQSIEYYMHHDYLTGLRNRRYLREYFKANDRGLGFILLDIDGLKVINDSFGLKKGDELLLKVSEFLSEFSDENSFVARYSGDEFIMVMKAPDQVDIRARVKAIKSASRHLSLNQITISVSIGWALQADKTIEESLKIAENMLYKKKIYADSSYRSKIIDTMMKTLHESNPREEAHSKRVSEYSYKLAMALNLGDKDVEEMKLAGLLHDIGKVAIHNRVVNKIGKLTEEEYVQMKMHAEKGYRILSSIENMSDIAIFIRHHHERYDGKGYPLGLKGSKIPLYSRIITIADAYDAMVSERPYKTALSKEAAIRELRKHSGHQFDPTIVEVFINQVLSASVDLTLTESTS